MWKYNINDLDDPNNPFGRRYKPRYVYELHIVHGKRAPQQQVNVQPSAVQEQPVRNSPKMVIPYVEVDDTLAEIPLQTSPLKIANRFYMVSGSITLSFKGEIKSQQSILKATFEGDKAKLAMQFQADGNKAFNNIDAEWDVNPADLNDSSCTATINNSPYSSTSVSVVGGIPSVDASTNDNGEGSSGVTFSPATPTSLTFHYDTEELETQSGSSIMKGQLHLEVNINVIPGDAEETASSPSFSQAWSEAKSKVEEAFLNGAGFATGNAGLILTMKPANPTPIFNGIAESLVQALEAPAPDNMTGAVLAPSTLPVTDMIPL